MRIILNRPVTPVQSVLLDYDGKIEGFITGWVEHHRRQAQLHRDRIIAALEASFDEPPALIEAEDSGPSAA